MWRELRDKLEPRLRAAFEGKNQEVLDDWFGKPK